MAKMQYSQEDMNKTGYEMWEEGIYEAQIINVTPTTSKRTGAEMWEMDIELRNGDDTKTIKEYFVFQQMVEDPAGSGQFREVPNGDVGRITAQKLKNILPEIESRFVDGDFDTDIDYAYFMPDMYQYALQVDIVKDKREVAQADGSKKVYESNKIKKWFPQPKASASQPEAKKAEPLPEPAPEPAPESSDDELPPF